MKWLLDGPLAAWDVESTGVDVETDRIVSACLAFIEPPKQPTVETWLINPGIDIPEEATQVHGITTDHARAHGVMPTTALPQIIDGLCYAFGSKTPVVTCNGSFDFTMLDREAARWNLPTLSDKRVIDGVLPVVDVYVLDKHIDPWRRGGRRLVELCTWYNVKIDGAHDAAFDAMAAARIAYRIALLSQGDPDRLKARYDPRRNPAADGKYGGRHKPDDIVDRLLALGQLNPVQLHVAQAGWRAEQQRGLAEYFAREKKPSDRMFAEWPVIPAGATPIRAEEKR